MQWSQPSGNYWNKADLPGSANTLDQSDAAKALADKLSIVSPSPLQAVPWPWPNPHNCRIWVKRDDLLHRHISGNKWRKLKYALLDVQQNLISQVISFGGGYSNHLHALAFCCCQLGIELIAIVRGDYSKQPSPMLGDIAAWGATIRYVDKITYQKRDNPDYLSMLAKQYPSARIIPEGGSQALAIPGVTELIGELTQTFDYVLAPVGSGGTLAGLIQGCHNNASKVIGVAVLKGQDYLETLVKTWLPPAQIWPNWHIVHDYHFGGYAKAPQTLLAFCQAFSAELKIPIEPVYSGKLMYATKDMLAKGTFPQNSNILLVHTGGLQGQRPG